MVNVFFANSNLSIEKLLNRFCNRLFSINKIKKLNLYINFCYHQLINEDNIL